MATQAQIDACRRNGRKSRGPITPEGRAKSSMNALKHGKRSKKLPLLRNESMAFEERRCKWMASADPKTDMCEYLVSHNVSLSFELDRAKRSHLERITSAIENSDDDDLEKVHELGKRLFFNPAAPSGLYGNRPGPESRTKRRTSWNGEAVDVNDPAVLVRKLESTAAGCEFLRQRWKDLKSELEPGRFWQAHSRYKAIKLLGSHPIAAIEDRRVAEIFVASHGLNPVGESAFEDLFSDMEPTQLVQYRSNVRAQWPDLVRATETDECRRILIDLVDRNIERLDAKLEVHEENADVDAERTVARLGFDHSAEAKELRAYMLKCTNVLYRGIETYRKYQGKKSKGGRGFEGEPRSIEDAGLTADDRGRRFGEAGLMVEDGGCEKLPVAGCEVPVAREQDGPEWTEEMDALHHVPDESLLRGDGEGTALEHELRLGAAGAGGDSHDESAADAVAEPGGQVIRQAENSENVTNEPKIDENVIIEQTQETVEVTANSDVDSGLDSGCQWSVDSGPLSPDDAAPSRALDRWEGGEADREEAGVVDSKSRVANLKTEGSPLGGRVALGGRRNRVSKGERRRMRRETERRELARRVEERLKAGKTPVEELIMDMAASKLTVAEIVLPHFPRSP
jgi:hypothetical protein